MNNLTAFVTLMAAISVASERVIEILKGIIPLLGKDTHGYGEDVRRAITQVLAGVVGAGVAYLGQSEIASTVPALSYASMGRASYLIIGLLASGGSGLWNHVLDIVQAMKITKEQAIPADSRPE